MKPCNEPCPKCESTDVDLEYVPEGGWYWIKTRSEIKRYEAEDETIIYACRRCGYQWEGCVAGEEDAK